MGDTIAMYAGRKGPFDNEARVESLIASNWGGLLVSPMGGKFQEWTRQGYVFSARSGAAAAIPVNSACANAPTLWNPADSAKIIVPIRIALSAAALGTQVIDGLTLMHEANMGSAAGAGLPFAAFTNIAPVCTRLGEPAVAKGKFANAAVTWTDQPAALMDLGMGQWVSGTAATGQLYDQLIFEFDGTVMMAPGTAICIGAATAATSGTYWANIVFAELPVITF